jgi:hypothetical protein
MSHSQLMHRLTAGCVLVMALATAHGLAHGGPEAVRRSADIERLGWLAGCWEGTLANGASYEEAWLAPLGGTMIGMARMAHAGRTVSFEFIRIAADAEGTLTYFAQPSGSEPTPFAATHIADSSVTFENDGNEFPQRIIYRLQPPDRLLARIEGQVNGEQRGMDFPLHRARCPGS